MKKKMRKFADGGEAASESSSGMEYLKKMAGFTPKQPKSDLDKLRSNIKSTGREMVSAAKSAAGATPVVSGMRIGARGLANMAKDMPKSYDEEMGMKKGGMAKKKMMGGGMAMKHGGKAHSDIAKDKPMMKKVAAKAVKGHEKRMHSMAKGGGIEIKGKTKGKMIKMKSGGAF
jgi:hypothetical protein